MHVFSKHKRGGNFTASNAPIVDEVIFRRCAAIDDDLRKISLVDTDFSPHETGSTSNAISICHHEVQLIARLKIGDAADPDHKVREFTEQAKAKTAASRIPCSQTTACAGPKVGK